MSILSRARIGGLILAAFGLAACGNDASDATTLFRALPAKLQGKSETASAVTAQQVAQALQATESPIMLFDAQTRKSQFIGIEIQRNGAYQTFASSTRQSITVRNGVISATRGFGGDLMSSELDGLLALVTARRAGNTTYVQRFLTADDQTVTVTYSCTVTPGGTTPVQSGTVNTTGQAVSAACTGDGTSFEAVFVVDPRGRVVGARQWLGDLIGTMIAQPLRL